MKNLESELNERVNNKDIYFLFWMIYFLKGVEKHEALEEQKIKLIKEILKELKEILGENEKPKESRTWKLIGRTSSLIGIGTVVWQIIEGVFLSLQTDQTNNKTVYNVLSFDQFNLSEFSDSDIEKAVNYANNQKCIGKFNL